MTKSVFVLCLFLMGSAAIGAIILANVVYDLKDQSNHVVVGAVNSTPLDAQFFKHLQEMRQNKDKLGDFLLIRDRLSAFVQEEMAREPRAFAALIEEAIPLAPQVGPITAMNLEPYASEVVRKEMETLRKEMQNLREEARVADFLKLKEQIQAMEKQVAAVKQQALLFSSVVPVLLVNFWSNRTSDDRAIFQITNLKTKEQKVFTLSVGGGLQHPTTQVIYLLPGEYEVETKSPSSSSGHKNFVLVHPEPKEEHEQKKYHAVVKTPYKLSE